VSQENFLFGGTIRENIAIVRPSAGMGDVMKAAQKAGAHEFITEMPEGYETMVEERGTRLSGGQRQRVAIARALIHNPSIILFDEATSALDGESERVVRQSLEKIRHGKTTIVIAHRLSTVQNFDTILVLDKGKLVEQGTPTDLMKANGLYSYLFKQQELELERE
jgi:subfamily B ATP-binding cassette protein HlyB/CyaB